MLEYLVKQVFLLHQQKRAQELNKKEAEANTDQLQSLAATVDIDRYNGALLAGLAGVVIKSHGSASERGFLHAILQGRDSVRGQLLQACTQALTAG